MKIHHLFLQAMTIIFGQCYRMSTKQRTLKAKENLLDQKRYSEQVKEYEAIVQKNQEKRLMYEQKYPELAKHRPINPIN